MPIFLFLKQLVDMFYQYKILDYGMVIFAVFLFGKKVWQDKIYLHLKEFLCPADFMALVLMCIYAASFLRYPSAYGTFFKIESCFLLYFLGRVYGREIMRHGRVLAGAGYLIVYSNFCYRFYQFGCKFIVTGPEETLLGLGGFYFYKTDLAVGVVIAVLFIYMFSEKKWLKWFTIIPICGYMVFYSGARMIKLVMAAEYFLILMRELEIRRHFEIKLKEKYVLWIMGAGTFFVLLFFVVLQFFPFEYVENTWHVETGLGSFLENLMHSRQIVWWELFQYFSDQSLFTRLFGIDLETVYLHNSLRISAHSMYLKQMYAVGYTGCFLFLGFLAYIFKGLCKETDRNLQYIVLILWIMLLGAGLTVESLESTQMSWFPMLFSGMILSAGSNKDQSGECEKESVTA